MAANSDNLSSPPPATSNASVGKPRRYRYSDAPVSPGLGASAASAGSLSLPATAAVDALPLNWSFIGLAIAFVGVCFLCLYPYEFLGLLIRWYSDSGWSHGFVVPLISAFFISLKWDKLRQLTPRFSLAGLFVLLLGIVGQVCFRATGTDHMSNLSMLVVLLGGSLFILGWEFMKVLWLPIGFLACAIPFPMPIYVALTTKLQIIAAEVGLFILTITGVDAQLSGTIINVYRNGTVCPLNVELACSGMKMLVAFFALAIALAYSTNRPIWQKLFLAICALPIAILCNAMRVAFTALLVAHWGEQWAKGSAHAYFGLLMLVPAMFLQLGVAWVLDKIFVEAK
ncbi:MAG: exosortase/archaeosortase family protein [Phycisphaerales bacterium]|nr:exosortase/archaeosortase family protein [Phycisphaerales bacterium]